MTSAVKNIEVCISMPAWGSAYVPFLLEFGIPSMLSRDNIPHLSGRYDIKFLISTTRNDLPAFEEHPSLARLRDVCEVIFDFVPDDEPPSMNRCHNLAMDITRNGPTFFPLADHVIPAGGFKFLMGKYEEGYRVVQVPGFRVNQEDFYELMRAKVKDGVLSISARELSAIALKLVHHSTAWHDWTGPIATSWPSFLYFDAGEEAAVFRHFHVHLMMCQPDTAGEVLLDDSLTFDARFVSRAVANRDAIYTVTDSDEYFIPSTSPASLLSRTTFADNERPAPATEALRVAQTAQWAASTADELEWRNFLDFPIVVHGSDTPAEAGTAIESSRAIAEQIKSVASGWQAMCRVSQNWDPAQLFKVVAGELDAPCLLAGPADTCLKFCNALAPEKRAHVRGFIDRTGSRTEGEFTVYSPHQINDADAEKILIIDAAQASQWFMEIADALGADSRVWVPRDYVVPGMPAGNRLQERPMRGNGGTADQPEVSQMIRLKNGGSVEFLSADGSNVVRAFDVDGENRFRVGFVNGNDGVDVNVGGTMRFFVLGSEVLRLDEHGDLRFIRDGKEIGSICAVGSQLVFSSATGDDNEDTTAPVQNACDMVRELQPVFVQTPEEGRARRTGFAAQPLRTALPEAIIGDDNGIDMAAITPVLAAAIKELIADVDKLKAQTGKKAQSAPKVKKKPD